MKDAITSFFSLLVLTTVGAQAQEFQISDSLGYPFYTTEEMSVSLAIENDSTSNGISSFTISNIYSTTMPFVSWLEAGWDYTFYQNPSNSNLWSLNAVGETNCQDCTPPGPQYIPTNGGSLSSTFVVTLPAGAQLIFAMVPGSAVFLNSGAVQQNPSGLVVPVGWQSGPFQVDLQPSQTNGLLALSWTGADGSIYVQHKSSVTDNEWLTLAGPLSGGASLIAASRNSTSDFFRLSLGPLTNATVAPPSGTVGP